MNRIPRLVELGDILDEKLDWNGELPDFYLFVTLLSIPFSSRIGNLCPINLCLRRYREWRMSCYKAAVFLFFV